jgi:hypothetical protein
VPVALSVGRLREQSDRVHDALPNRRLGFCLGPAVPIGSLVGRVFAPLADVGARCRPELRRRAQWRRGPALGKDGFAWGAWCKARLWYNSALERLVINVGLGSLLLICGRGCGLPVAGRRLGRPATRAVVPAWATGASGLGCGCRPFSNVKVFPISP